MSRLMAAPTIQPDAKVLNVMPEKMGPCGVMSKEFQGHMRGRNVSVVAGLTRPSN